MNQTEVLAERFEADRPRLRGVAYRMLGSLAEADDALQEAWLRIHRGDSGVENLGGWLTTVVARVCLDMLRARKSRREGPLEPAHVAPSPDRASNPEDEAALAEMVGLAMLVVLDALSPAERVAFVLHDTFDVPFEAIGHILERTPEAARQLASRARRRVRGSESVERRTIEREREVVDAFLAASRNGDFRALMAMLAPEVVFRADEAAALKGSVRQAMGAEAVAKQFAGRAVLARSALIDGRVGIVVAPLGKLLLVLKVRVEHDKIASIEAVMERDHLARLTIAVPPTSSR